MHVLKRNPWLSGLGVLLAALVVYGGRARADVTTDQPGSVIIFPKVISDGSRDTLIEISNASNSFVTAHCIYINASGTCSVTTTQSCRLDSDCPSEPSQESCMQSCLEDNFDITLTPQQPTFWSVRAGRADDPLDFVVGTDPGNVPARGTTFEGELKCIQTDTTDAPSNGNALKGKACIFGDGASSSLVSDYNAITIQSLPALNADNDLLLGTEYNACPASLILNHYAEGATDDFTSALVSTELTLVPCTEDLENQPRTGGTPVNALALITNELEFTLSVPIQFDCFFNRRLADIPEPHLFSSPQPFDLVSVRTPFAKTRIRPAGGSVCYTGDNRGLTCDPALTNSDCPNFQTSPDGTQLGCRPYSSIIGVAEEFQTTAAGTGNDAFTLGLEGTRPGDVIVVPAVTP